MPRAACHGPETFETGMGGSATREILAHGVQELREVCWTGVSGTASGLAPFVTSAVLW